MKLLIACDGSDCSEAAINDLKYAGLPDVAEALVLSVGEATLRLPEAAALAAVTGYRFPDDPTVEAWNERQVSDVRAIATDAADRLATDFPKWRITTVEALGSPQSTIVNKAMNWKPDLVVVGSHGRSGLKQFTLGSVSRYVLRHSKCSVRIGHCRHSHGTRGIRLLIGTDGSDHAMAAVRSVAARPWPSETQVRIISVVDSRPWLVMPLEIQPALNHPTMIEDRLRALARSAAEDASNELSRFNLSAMTKVGTGSPGGVLISEAQRWNADCIFVGDKGHNALERVLLGSVSTAVALRSPCSVEVVRGLS